MLPAAWRTQIRTLANALHSGGFVEATEGGHSRLEFACWTCVDNWHLCEVLAVLASMRRTRSLCW